MKFNLPAWAEAYAGNKGNRLLTEIEYGYFWSLVAKGSSQPAKSAIYVNLFIPKMI